MNRYTNLRLRLLLAKFDVGDNVGDIAAHVKIATIFKQWRSQDFILGI